MTCTHSHPVLNNGLAFTVDTYILVVLIICRKHTIISYANETLYKEVYANETYEEVSSLQEEPCNLRQHITHTHTHTIRPLNSLKKECLFYQNKKALF